MYEWTNVTMNTIDQSKAFAQGKKPIVYIMTNRSNKIVG